MGLEDEEPEDPAGADVGDLKTALRLWWVRQGQPGPDEWLVPTRDNERRRAVDWMNHALHRICVGPVDDRGRRRPVIEPPVTFHGLRHSFASLALEAGNSLLDVSRILGHHSPEFTARQYAHVSERRLVQTVDRLSGYLQRNGGGQATPAVRRLPAIDPAICDFQERVGSA